MIAAFDRSPATLDAVLSPDWLTNALSNKFAGIRVVEVRVVETLVTQATKVRLELTLAEPCDLARNICIKGILTPTGSPPVASVTETRFYRDCADALSVRVPPCWYAELADDGSSGVVIMQDMIAQGATFGSALAPLSPVDAMLTVGQLAKLHASTWSGSRNSDRFRFDCFLDFMVGRPLLPIDALQELLDGSRGIGLTGDCRDATAICRALTGLAGQILPASRCLIHGDAHAGNLYRDAGGFGFVDWQIFQTGSWAQDIAYHLATVLTPEDRRIHERSLLDYYRSRLKGWGGPDLPPDEAWTRYRSAMIYGFYLWANTRTVDDNITNEFVRKLGIAIADLDSFALVGV